MLSQIQSHFGGVGEINKYTKNAYQYRVISLLPPPPQACGGRQDLINVIIPHFIKYPLNTQKRADFELLLMVVELMIQKKHVTLEGLQQIINIKASMNLGLSDALKSAFPNFIQVERPKVELIERPDPN